MLNGRTELYDMTVRQVAFFCILFTFVILLLVDGNVSFRERKCQKIRIPMCKDLGYNWTEFPNVFNQVKQKEAALEVHQFWPLVQINCSPVLKFFLCTQYAPICESTFGHEKLLPCRSVCKKAKKGCVGLMKNYGFPWPKTMRCRKYPRNICLSPNYPSFLKNRTKIKFRGNKDNRKIRGRTKQKVVQIMFTAEESKKKAAAETSKATSNGN